MLLNIAKWHNNMMVYDNNKHFRLAATFILQTSGRSFTSGSSSFDCVSIWESSSCKYVCKYVSSKAWLANKMLNKVCFVAKTSDVWYMV